MISLAQFNNHRVDFNGRDPLDAMPQRPGRIITRARTYQQSRAGLGMKQKRQVVLA